MSELSKIKTCRDITEDQIAEAIETREDTRALLDHAAKISAARTGGARVLLLFARMASPACDWIDGALRVEINGDSEGSSIETFAEIGAGLKERIFPAISIDVPIEEFVIAVKKFPKAIAPLAFTRPSQRRIVLTAGEVEKVERASSVPPPRKVATNKEAPPLSLGDLPTVGAPAPKSSPPAAAHLPAVVMSASQLPPPAGTPAQRLQTQKFSTKTEIKIGGASKIPSPVRKKTEAMAVFEPPQVDFPLPLDEAPPLPIVEAVRKPEPAIEAPPPKAEPIRKRTEPMPVFQPTVDFRNLPVVEAKKPAPDLPVVEAKKPDLMPSISEIDLPVPSVATPPKALARIQLKRQQTPASLPRVIEEVDARSPSAPRKRNIAPKKPFVVPPPPEEPAKEEAASEDAATGPSKKSVDEGWE